MNTVDIVYARIVKLNCPGCDAEEEGFLGDPRGNGQYQCERCGTWYKVAPDARVVLE